MSDNLNSQILQQYESHRSYAQIAAATGLTVRAVKDRLKTIRDRSKSEAFAVIQPGSFVAERPCISCREPFRSQWIGHRICPDCRERHGLSAA